MGFDGVQAGEDHGLDFFKAGEGLFGSVDDGGDGVTDLGVGDGFDVAVQVSGFTGGEFIAGNGFGGLVAEAFHFEGLAVGHELDFLAHFDASVDDTAEDDDAAVGVEPGIEDEDAQGRFGVTFGLGDEVDDGFENFLDTDAVFGGGEDGSTGVEADELFDLLADAFGLGGGEVDFVDNRDDFEVMVEGEVGIGEGLGFDTLGGIDDEEGAFAGLEGAGDLVGEVDVAGGVDEVELVHDAVIGLVVEADGVGFDGDAAFTFEVHGVEDLGHHFAFGEGSGEFEEAVGEGGLAVVDVGDDGEIAYVLRVHSV